MNKLQWNFHWNSNIFIRENGIQNVVSEMASILSRRQCVNNTIQSCVKAYSRTRDSWGIHVDMGPLPVAPFY